MMSLFY